jgi:hypothetical protein
MKYAYRRLSNIWKTIMWTVETRSEALPSTRSGPSEKLSIFVFCFFSFGVEVYTGFNASESIVRTCKLLRSPGIDPKKWIPPAYVAWRAGPTNGGINSWNPPIYGLLKSLQIRAQHFTSMRFCHHTLHLALRTCVSTILDYFA